MTSSEAMKILKVTLQGVPEEKNLLRDALQLAITALGNDEAHLREAYEAGARTFMMIDPIARPFQEQALPKAWEEWWQSKKEWKG